LCYNILMRTWVLKRRLIGIGIVTVLGLTAFVFAVITQIPEPTCTDGLQNGEEGGVDCGGACEVQCLGEIPTQPKRLWQRYFLVRPGVYDVGAMIENTNLFIGARDFSYKMKLYDSENVLLAEREGRTFLLPKDRTFIFEPNMVPGPRIPARVDFSFEPITWERLDSKRQFEMQVVSQSFETDPHPLVKVNLQNASLFEEKRIEVSVVLEGADGNAFAAARTYLENFAPGSQRTVSFAWPTSHYPRPARIDILYRRVLE